MHATDVVAYTYQADIYCPGCIAAMFTEPDTGPGVSAENAAQLTTEEVLERVAAQGEIDYSDPYSYDSDNFPKVVFADQANDMDFDHCGNSADALNGRQPWADVCEVHIAHDEKDCRRWRNIDVRGPDFMGHKITWTDLDDYGFALDMEQAFPSPEPGRVRWRYRFTDEQWQSPHDQYRSSTVPVFAGEDFATPAYDDEPAIVGGLLGFLSLQPGDTDSDYFDEYTPRQTAWMEERAETLSLVQFDQFEGE